MVDLPKSLERILAQRKLYQFSQIAYDWQREFMNAGADNPERMLMAANGVGKSIVGSFETACHLTGDYPEWWEGHRFTNAPSVWVGSITNLTQRDITQPLLLGVNLTEDLGTGFIPRDRIVGKIRIRQAGIPEVADGFSVRHVSGGLSKCLFKTYEQGWRMWQGSAPNVIWGDEQPDESASNEKMIFSECQTRVFRSGGIMYWTLTPLLGETNMISHFMSPQAKGIYWLGATWDDAPHLAEVDKERLRATYPAHELEVRTQGVPMMGEGRVFTSSEDDIKISDFDVPSHWARIKGIDFGFDHPAAVAEIAWDRDRDVIYLIRCWKKSRAEIEEHCDEINFPDPWVPVAWPHDGNATVRGKKGHDQLKNLYVHHGVKMLSRSACYKNDKQGGQAVEPIVQDIEERSRSGGFKVFASCRDFFQEYRNYHRKDGKIVALKDDVLKATFYAVMMKRYATTQRRRSFTTAPSGPIMTARL